jgi:heat shock protein HtpX
MWELIRSNQRKSIFLFSGMAITLILLGYLIGSTFVPDGGGVFGIAIAIIIWTVLSIISVTAGSSLVLSVSQAKEVTPAVHQQLFNVVEEMKIAAGLPAMPKVYIIDSPALNAFATGKDPQNSAVAVTAGLLSKLNRDELQGVIGHEMSHIMNRDTKFMTYAAVMLGTIVIIAEIFVKGMFYTGAGRRYGSRSKNAGGQAQIIILAIAIIFAILAPIMARLLYFALSRKREYLADASSARLTRYPEGLASALEKISECRDDLPSANKVTAAMYIANPLKKKGMKLSDLTSTHPPISERIRILRGMMYGAGFSDYQKSYSALKRSSAAIIPPSELRDGAVIPLRAAGDQAEPQNAVQEKRKLGNIMMAVNDYSTITCECGLKIKMPPGFGMNKPEITCPRCGRKHRVESAGRIKI